VAAGNLLLGVPLTREGDFLTGFFRPINGYALLVAALLVLLFSLHGGLYLCLKTDGPVAERARADAWRQLLLVALAFAATTAMTLTAVPGARTNLSLYPWGWALVIASVATLGLVAERLWRRQFWQALVVHAAFIAQLVALFGFALFPYLVRASNDPALSLSLYDSAASRQTLGIMLVLVLVGMPLVLAYTVFIYRTFRGKVRLDSHSY